MKLNDHDHEFIFDTIIWFATFMVVIIGETALWNIFVAPYFKLPEVGLIQVGAIYGMIKLINLGGK